MLVLTFLALLAPQAPAQETTVTSAAAPKDKVVCRSETEVGSRIPTRICRTQAEWDQIYKETQDDLNNSRNDRGVAPNGL
jgi:hypothetical protein